MVNFVGAGCGAADLITVRGLRLIKEADVIIYAGSLVNPELLKDAKKDCAVYDSAKMTLEQVLAVMKQAEAEGKKTVRLHTGDPSLYGAIREQMDALSEAGISFEVCPGVSSFSGAAASLKAELTLPGVSQTVILTRMAGRTSVPERESFRSLAAHHATMPDTPAAIVYKATWPEERIFRCTVSSLWKTAEEAGIKKTAMILIGGVLGEKEIPGFERSRLYAPDFSTGFRKGTKD